MTALEFCRTVFGTANRVDGPNGAFRIDLSVQARPLNGEPGSIMQANVSCWFNASRITEDNAACFMARDLLYYIIHNGREKETPLLKAFGKVGEVGDSEGKHGNL